MLSRVANSLYWMSRYIEREETIARLVDTNLQLLLDYRNLDEQRLARHWLPIILTAVLANYLLRFVRWHYYLYVIGITGVPGSANIRLIAIRSRRKIVWDPVKEQIVGDDDASRRLSRAMREPWKL